jgi:hypothetical protein
LAAAIQSLGGVEYIEDQLWKMIAFASRYGHQPLVILIGDVTVERVSRFCDALQYWLRAEQHNSRGIMNSIAEGGG